MRQFAVIVLLACLSTPALAVYKCEIDGKTIYRDQPCSGGKELATEPAPAGPNAQQQLAQDKAKASQLERERHKREAQEAREQRQEAKRAASRKKRCDSLALKKKWADEDAARTSGKSREKALIKSRRASEKLTQECS